MITALKNFYKTIVGTIDIFIDRSLITMSAALAYYAIFSLPPLLLIVLMSTRNFYFWGSTEGFIFSEIESLIGPDATEVLRESIVALSNFEDSGFSLAVSIAVILFTSTSIFVVLQNGFNRIFKVKANPTVWKGILKYVFNRLVSLGLLVGFAFLLVVSLAFNMLINAFSHYMLGETLSTFYVEIMGSITIPLIFLIVFFGFMFKVLPDVRMPLKHVWPGAIFTATLFIIGKYIIGAYIGNSSFNSAYSSASSLLVIMVWSYYSSMLVLLGCAYLRSDLEIKDRLPEIEKYAEEE